MVKYSNLSLFTGGLSRNWKASSQKFTKGFINKYVCMLPTYIINKLNCVLNILFKVIINNKIVWILDSNSMYLKYMNSNYSNWTDNNIFYLTDIPKGFFTNKNDNEVNFEYPCLVLFLNAKQNESFIRSLKDKGVICVGFLPEENKLLDYVVYYNSKTFDLFIIILSFISYCIQIKKFNLKSNEKI